MPIPQPWTVRIVPSRELKVGGALLALGSLLWVIHSLLIFASWVPIVAAGVGIDPSQNAESARGFYAGALAMVVAGAPLLAIGILTVRRGSVAYSVPDTGFRATLGISTRAAGRARLAFPFLLAYGILAAVSLAALLVQSLLAIFLLLAWVLGAALLVVGGLLFSSFTEDVRRETMGLVNLRGDWLRDYAIANLIGVAVLSIGGIAASLELRLALTVVGGAIQFLAVPISGIAVFGELMVQSAQAARARTTTVPSAAAFGAIGASWPGPLAGIPPRPDVAPGPSPAALGFLSGVAGRSVEPPPKELPAPPAPDEMEDG